MTEEQIKQLEADKVKLETEKAQLKADLEKAQKSQTDGQKLLDKWGNEMGEMKKQLDESKKSADSLKTQLDEIQKLRDELKNLKEAAAKGAEGAAGQKPSEGTQVNADEIEKSLSAQEQSKLDKVYDHLKEKAQKGDQEAVAEIKKIREDQVYRAEFLRAAKTGGTDALPDTWRKEPAKATGDDLKKIQSSIAKLFTDAKQASSFVPPGSSGGAAAPTGRGAPPRTSGEMGKWGKEYFQGQPVESVAN